MASVHVVGDWFSRCDSKDFVGYWKDVLARDGGALFDRKTGRQVAGWVKNTFWYRHALPHDGSAA